jgi:hypothetical protein
MTEPAPDTTVLRDRLLADVETVLAAVLPA